MNKTAIFRLHFKTPLHISSSRADYGVSDNFIHSDTIYSAIMQAWSLLGKEDLIKPDISFCLTSTFPFYLGTEKGNSNQKPVYFLPKPIGSLSPKDVSQRKEIKKITWIEKSLFFELLKGLDVSGNEKAGIFLLSSKDLIPEGGFFLSQVQMRNRIPRAGGDTEPYYVDRVYFKDNSGLYFIFYGNEEDFQNVIQALEFLEDEGIGTDRHVGNGHFELQIEEDIDWFSNLSNADYMVSLSLFHPGNNEEATENLKTMLSEKCAYDIILRGGWITQEAYSTLRKKSVRMFSEGSIFANPKIDTFPAVMGNIVNIRPDEVFPKDKNIFRFGKALFLPIKIN